VPARGLRYCVAELLTHWRAADFARVVMFCGRGQLAVHSSSLASLVTSVG
jgi:hypothetical protein